MSLLSFISNWWNNKSPYEKQKFVEGKLRDIAEYGKNMYDEKQRRKLSNQPKKKPQQSSPIV